MSDIDARARVMEAGGAELVERLDHLDAVLRQRRGGLPTFDKPLEPRRGDIVDFDVAIAGGGLWSLLAPLLAMRGHRVAVFERAKTGTGHREWNASLGELRALSRLGLWEESALSRLVVARYAQGTCKFHGGTPHAVRGVLDCAVDASELLLHARTLGETHGVTYIDGSEVLGHAAGDVSVRCLVREGRRHRDVTAKLLVDARGAASPFATADLLCPTVGGVISGLAEGSSEDTVDPSVGEILVTLEGIEEGRQHVWELFPGRSGEATVYVFYYADRRDAGSLVDLYARFFRQLPSYKRGEPKLLRPTFGLIPGWSRLAPAPASDSPRVVLVGDAAARHSPLTYCGFGATLRSLAPACDALDQALLRQEAPPPVVVADAPIHAFTGVLAQLMASRSLHGSALNALLDAAFTTLEELGQDAYASLLQDTMSAESFVRFLRRTAQRYPSVWPTVFRGLGLRRSGKFGLTVARAMARGA